MQLWVPFDVQGHDKAPVDVFFVDSELLLLNSITLNSRKRSLSLQEAKLKHYSWF